MANISMNSRLKEDKLVGVIEYDEVMDTWQYSKNGVSVFCDDYEIDWNESRLANDLYLKNCGYIVAKVEL